MIDAGAVRILPAAPVTPSRQIVATAPTVTELMVTARKRPERLDSLPAGVSVLSGEQLRASGLADARDTAGQLVGVTTTNLGPGRDKLLMRGLSDGAFTGRARSTVGTYLDDTPINYNAPTPTCGWWTSSGSRRCGVRRARSTAPAPWPASTG